LNDNKWPSSKEFLEKVLPRAEDLLTSRSLFSGWLFPWLIVRHPFLTLGHRAGLLSKRLKTIWGIAQNFSDLEDSPKWLVNSTSYASGKNWRFSKEYVGDWRFGRNYSADFSIADGMAASAAVPTVIGALKLKLPDYGWYEINPATSKAKISISPPQKKVKLWDGGVYENLGIEAIYKPGRGLIDCNKIIISDAGAPLRPTWMKRGWSFSPRLFDITSDQIRSLRSRQIIPEFGKEIEGGWLQMGLSAHNFSVKTGMSFSDDVTKYQDDQIVSSVVDESTHLSMLTTDRFNEIKRHGREVATYTMFHYWGDGRL